MTPLPPSFEDTGLRHSLKQRHMSMIALGGVIGAGLFVGSKVIIASAGPATVISFLITGLLVVLVMKMLGEMAVAMPRTGSFYEYARLALGDLAGFLTGWMYWYFWVIVVAIEAVAGAEIIRIWIPELPLWAISLGLMIILTLSNLVSVRSYGEIEFWFASIKVTVIVVFLLLGTCYVLGFWPSATPGLANLTAHGGFAPNGIAPVLSGAVVATGFYFGAEVVTIAAAEAKEPGKAVARATNSVITRVLVFYIGSVLLVVMIVPWNAPEMATPYVSAMTAMGLPAAAQIMQVVILTAVLSAFEFRPLRLLAHAVRVDAGRGCPADPGAAQRQGRTGQRHPVQHAVRLWRGRDGLSLARNGLCLSRQLLRDRRPVRVSGHCRFAGETAA